MAYELYQSRHKGYEIDNLLDDVVDLKPKVAAMEQGYDANKVKMADGTVLPAFLVTQMASKNDISDMATNQSVSQDIQNATKDFVSETDVENIISNDFANKDTLDDLTTSTDGNLLFKGQEIKGGGTDVEANPTGPATSDLQKLRIADTIYGIEGGSGGTGGDLYFGYEDYSEEEKVVGKWKDGKPVYRKVINIQDNIPAGIKEFDLGISFDNIISTKIIRTNSEYNVDTYCDSYLWTSTPTSLYIRVPRDIQLAGGKIYIIAVYTKTTDEPNSFKPSLMTNNVLLPVAPSYDDYSEEEIVIGKWIDGKPIYRKCFSILKDIPLNTWFIVMSNTFNGDLPIKVILYALNNRHMLTSIDCQFYKSDNNIYMCSSVSITGANLICIEYTKTTDEPNSFTPDMIKTIPMSEEATEQEVEDIINGLF